jgi:putative transposase
VHRTVRYLLQPTAGQRVRLDHLLWEQRKLYNRSLEQRQTAWQGEGRSLSRYEQFAGLNGIAKTDPDGLGRYGTCVARGTLTRLDLAFKAFYRRCQAGDGDKPGHPRFKSRWRFHSVSYPDASGWKLNEDSRRLYLQGVGHAKLKLHRRLPGRPKTAVVKREGRRWWVVVACDRVPAEPLVETGRQVGIDLGVASTLTTSDGNHVANPRFTRRAADGLAAAQRDLATKKRGTRRRRNAVEHVAAHHRKVANCRRDHAHQLSRRLVDGYDLIVHEDLRITNMVRSASGTVDVPGTNVAQKSGLNRSIHDAGWGQLLSFVAYKAEEAGREVIAVDPRNTSRTCAACGHVAAGNRLTQAVFRCLACGHSAHADENAAVNILRAGQAQRRGETRSAKRASRADRAA